MSCEIKLLAKVSDLKQVQELFGFPQDDNWLNAVHYALSPTTELLVVAHGTQIVFLGSRWDNETQHSRYTITWKGDLENANDIITATVCLPIVGFSASVQSTPEWTCVCVGLSTGVVQFFTDSGLEIYAQQWHNEPVQSIRAQSGKRKNEEIHVYYLTCVCIIQGSHLLQMLRSMKNHLQKAASSFKTEQSPLQEALPCRKWSYGGKSLAINDAVVVGPQKISTFDHLLTASMEGGFYARYKSAPPLNALVIGVGQKPYAGFHWAKEGFMQPVLADVARAVASKIKSALPTWLTGSQPPQADAPPPPVPAEPMTLRFGLCDQQRTGLSVWLAPDNLYAAVTDNLGRVMLIDCFRGITVRVWKGYREAHCSFVKVTEKATKNSTDRPDRRHALFLVIFAPRRSCIEIWGLQRGQKVAAFTVSKFGQLIYNPHTFMGVGGGSKVKYTSNICVFLDPTDMSLKEIVIPFHCALTDSNSKTAKDLHLLRRIKLCLRSGDGTEDQQLEEVRNSCFSLQTDEIRLQCIEMLVKNNKIKPLTLKAALDVFTESFVNEGEANPERSDDGISQEPGIDHDTTALLQRAQLQTNCINYSRLVAFYLYVSSSTNVQQSLPHMEDEFKKSEEPVKLNISEIELENLQKYIDLTVLERSNASRTRVTFNERTKSNEFVDYLSAFDCCCEDENETTNWIRLRPEKTNLLASVGYEIYGQFMEKGKNLDDFVSNATQSRICGEELMKVFLFYWLKKPFSYTRSEDLIIDLTQFTAILQNICCVDEENVQYEYNAVSYWWQAIREILLESPHTLMSLIAAMMCRNYAARFRKRENSQDDSDVIAAEEELWETVSQEAAEWSLLIDKLDDVAALGAILTNSRPTQVDAALPILSYEIPDVSLRAIVSGGKGIVSELVAKWILSLGINPLILLESDVSESRAAVDETDANDDVSRMENPSFLHYLSILRDHFPFSLQSGIIIIHMTWEYMCAWSKNMQKLDYFKAALSCLAAIKPADHAIKHGLCCMIWNAHLKIPLEATRKLVNKTGRLPKEKLCLQDIGISDSLVPEMLEHCTNFLDHFNSSIDNEKMDLRYEELLQEGPVSLALLALQQNIAISETVKLHIQLNHVLYMIAALNLKYAKPIQCVFDAMSNQTFFTEINRPLPYTLPPPDLVLQRKRMEFLCLAISATIDLIRVDLECIFLNDHILWMDRIEALSNIWQLDNDQLKKHQIVELYAYGWDDYAEEQLESVLDTQPLGSLLLKIAGRRLNIFTKNTPNAYAQVASFGPLVTDYLDTIHNSSNHLVHRGSDDISIDKLIGLTGQAFKCLAHKDSKELRVAGQMFDACHHLKELM